MKDMNINIQDAQGIPSKINSETHTKTHYYKLSKDKEKENIKSSERRANHYIQGILNKMMRFLISKFGRQWANVFKVLKERNCQPRILHPATVPQK